MHASSLPADACTRVPTPARARLTGPASRREKTTPPMWPRPPGLDGGGAPAGAACALVACQASRGRRSGGACWPAEGQGRAPMWPPAWVRRLARRAVRAHVLLLLRPRQCTYEYGAPHGHSTPEAASVLGRHRRGVGSVSQARRNIEPIAGAKRRLGAGPVGWLHDGTKTGSSRAGAGALLVFGLVCAPARRASRLRGSAADEGGARAPHTRGGGHPATSHGARLSEGAARGSAGQRRAAQDSVGQRRAAQGSVGRSGRRPPGGGRGSGRAAGVAACCGRAVQWAGSVGALQRAGGCLAAIARRVASVPRAAETVGGGG